jgi:hypothetical protein
MPALRQGQSLLSASLPVKAPRTLHRAGYPPRREDADPGSGEKGISPVLSFSSEFSRVRRIEETPRTRGRPLSEPNASKNIPKTFGSFARALMKPQMLRTCKDCGTEWKVPRYFARRKGVARPSAMSRVSRVATRTSASGQATRAHEVPSRRAVEAGLRSAYALCPSCGRKGGHSQHRLWFAGRQSNID